MYLYAMLAMSTTGEHSFSRSGWMVSKFCHNLSDKSVCAATVYAAWNKHGLIPKDKIIMNKKEKGPHWRVEDNGHVECSLLNSGDTQAVPVRCRCRYL